MNKVVIFFQRFINVFAWIFLTLFGIGLILTLLGNLNTLGGYKQLIVQSGSMEPTIMTGDVIVIAKAGTYQKNDVITFQDIDKGITTHRVDSVNDIGGEKQFVTKGDANRVQDSDIVSEKEIMGKLILTIPKLGFFISFLRSKIGFSYFLFF